MRMIAGYLLTLLVLLGNIGLPVYSHTCETAGRTSHSVGIRAVSCSTHKEPEPEKPSCCHKPKVQTTHTCCTDSIDRLALSFHFVHLSKTSPVVLPDVAIAAVFLDEPEPILSTEKNTFAFDYRPPPWRSVGRFLSDVCTWRI